MQVFQLLAFEFDHFDVVVLIYPVFRLVDNLAFVEVFIDEVDSNARFGDTILPLPALRQC